MNIRALLSCLAISSFGGLCAAEPARVAVVGDSIACGVGTKQPEKDAFPAQLQRMLGGTWIVGNFGCSGSNVLKQGTRPYQNQDRFRNARDFKPATVVILLGTNDTAPQNWKLKSQFSDDYKDLIRRLKEFESKPRILVCSPPYISNKTREIEREQNVLELIPLLDDVAKSESVKVVDIHGAMVDREDLLFDGINPNNAGATAIAGTIYEGLTGKKWTGDVPDEILSDWNGFERQDFLFNKEPAILVVPKNALPGKPWIWRPEFFDAFPAVDIALLGAGYHVAYVNMHNQFGAPNALKTMDAFYAYLVNKKGLSPKPVLEGFSRGGLYALNWAAKNPDKVSALYLDAPVCDFNSWPGGKGKGPGSPADWTACLGGYGLTEKEALTYPLKPVENLKPIAEAKIPIIAVAGDADTLVPMDENINLVEKRYGELGGKIQVITKPGVGHHPHSLQDPTPVVNFLLQNAIKTAASK